MDDDAAAVVDWHGQLVEQLDWHWRHFARPRLDGLTDEEYRWEPVPGCWNVRPRESGSAPIQAGSGEFTCDFAVPEPDPPPVTTIAWRLAHVTIGVFGARAASHFGGPPIDYPSYDYPGDAATALHNLDAVYASWVDGVNGPRQRGAGQAGRSGRRLVAGEPDGRPRTAHQP